jgi:hypothetical protein
MSLKIKKYCRHGNLKNICYECYSTFFCIHKINKTYCKICKIKKQPVNKSKKLNNYNIFIKNNINIVKQLYPNNTSHKNFQIIAELWHNYKKNGNNSNIPIDDSNIPIDDLNIPIDDLNIPIDDLNIPIDDLNIPIDDLNIPIDDLNIPIDDLNSNIIIPSIVIDNYNISTSNIDLNSSDYSIDVNSMLSTIPTIDTDNIVNYNIQSNELLDFNNYN